MPSELAPIDIARKPARESRIRYFDLGGKEIRRNRESTSVAVIRFGSPFAWE